MSPNGKTVFVAGYNSDGTITAVDTVTNTVLDSIQAGSRATHLVVIPGAP